MFESETTITSNKLGDEEMGNHRDNNNPRMRAVEPEIVDNPNTNGPSPSGLATGLAVSGRFPQSRDSLRAKLNSLHERYSTAAEQIIQATTAETVFVEQMAQEAACRYEETIKWHRKNGS